MRVLIISQWYPYSGNPYAGIFVLEQAKALAKHGIEVQIFFPFDPSVEGFDFHDEDGLVVWRCNLSGIRISQLLKFLVMSRKIRKQFAFDIIHAHEIFWAGIYSGFLSHLIRAPLVITEHYDKLASLFRTYGGVKRRLVKWCSREFVAVSKFSGKTLSELLKIPLENISIVPNLVDESRFSVSFSYEFSPKQLAPGQALSLLFVGVTNFAEDSKGLKVLIDALSLLDRKRYSAKAIGVVDIARFREYASNKGVGNLELIPPVHKESVIMEMMNCNIFVLPSYQETFGCVIAEALTCGKPVVATLCGGPEEIVRSSDGRLVPVSDSKGLARAIEEIANHLSEFDPKSIRENAIQRFSSQRIISQLVSVYMRLVCS